jgi:hypothetical protein
VGQELEGESIVVRFTRCKSETDGQSIGINHHMNLTGQSASRPAHGLFLIASDTSGVLMNAHNGRVYHLNGCIMSAGKRFHDPNPDTRPTPSNITVAASGVGAKALRHIASRGSGSQNPKDAVQDTPVVHAPHAARLIRQPRLDGNPLIIGEFIAHDSRLQFGGWNHGLAADLNSALSGTRPAVECQQCRANRKSNARSETYRV